MKPRTIFLCLVFILVAAWAPTVPAADFHGGINVGTSAGLGMQATGTFMNFTRDVPLSARFALGYHSPAAGDPYAARRIFINDNTNGSPEKGAHLWQFRFDLMLPVMNLGTQPIYLYGGPRHSRYTANFDYIGGNENFDVTSNPWGIGLGLESWFSVGDTTDFVLSGGIDWFTRAKLAGHDTEYLPTGDHVNGRDDYEWEDADTAIAQPRWEILAMMGLRFQL